MKKIFAALVLGALTVAVSAQAATFECGGVGTDDQARIKSQASQHDMLITFATPGGAYIADVDVRVTMGKQEVLAAHCNGPLMLMDVGKKGTYVVQASSNGRAQSKTVTAGTGRTARLSFIWPDD